MPIFYINGKFVEEKKAKISVYDLGFLRSYAVFDFLRTYNGKPFYLNEHLKRLLNSAKLIGLEHNFTLNFLRKAVLNTLSKNKSLKESNIRIILTGGTSKDTLTPSKPNLIIMVTPIKQLPESLYLKGAKIITKISERVIPQAKTTVYFEGIKFLKEAKRKNAIEVLFVDRKGKIFECVTSNFFAVINRKLITPKSDEILQGITRNIVIKLAEKLKIPVVERDIYLSEMKKFNESFITATNKEILPIVKIDGTVIGDGKVGKITKLLMIEFKKLTHSTSIKMGRSL